MDKNTEQLLEQLPHLVYVMDADTGECIFVNTRFYELLGYETRGQEQATELLESRLHPDDRDKLLPKGEIAQSRINNGLFHEDSLRFLHRNGTVKHFAGRFTRFVIPQDTRNLLLGSLTDVTSQVNQHLEAQANASAFHFVIEKSLVGICITDDKGRFEYVNPVYCDIYGYTSEELIGQHFTIVAPSNDRYELWQEIHDQFLENEEEIAGEWVVKNKKGDLLSITTDAVRYKAADGKYRKITFVQDLTPLRNKESELSDLKARYKVVAEQSLMGVAFFDPNDLMILDVNEQFCLLTGHTRKELLEQSLNEFTLTNGSDIGKAINEVNNTRKAFTKEIILKNKDASYIPCEAELARVDLEGYPMIGMLVKAIQEPDNAIKTHR